MLIPMFKELKNELKKIEAENDLLIDILKSYSEIGKIDKISIGMKVRISYNNGKTQDGRVIRFSPMKKQWMINRDGYAGTIGIPENQLELLYPGIEGIMDKKQWLNNNKINDLKSIIKGSDLPSYFKDKEYLNIKVVAHFEQSHGYCLIDCEVNGYNPAFRIKLPSPFAIDGIFLQLHIFDGDIIDIHLISKERYLNLE
jgi:hypothetical protein